MATIATFDDLVAEIARIMDAPSAADNAPGYIQFAEADFGTEIANMEGDITVFTSTTAGDETLAFPVRLERVNSLTIGSNPTHVLTQLSVDDLRTKWADYSARKPEDYALSGDQIILGPAPDAVYTAVLVYAEQFAPLTAANQVNWLLSSYPNLYLYASLLHAEFDGWNDERLQTIEAYVEKTIARIVRNDAIKRKGDFAGTVAGVYY